MTNMQPYPNPQFHTQQLQPGLFKAVNAYGIGRDTGFFSPSPLFVDQIQEPIDSLGITQITSLPAPTGYIRNPFLC